MAQMSISRFLRTNRIVWNFFDASSMRDRGIVLDPYLDHGVLVRVCQEVGVPVEELDPSSAGATQVRSCTETCHRDTTASDTDTHL